MKKVKVLRAFQVASKGILRVLFFLAQELIHLGLTAYSFWPEPCLKTASFIASPLACSPYSILSIL